MIGSSKKLIIRHGKRVSGENGTKLSAEETSPDLQGQDLHHGVGHGVQLRGTFGKLQFTCRNPTKQTELHRLQSSRKPLRFLDKTVWAEETFPS